MNTTASASTSSNTAEVTQGLLGEGAYGRVTLVSTANGRLARKTFLRQKDWQYELEVSSRDFGVLIPKVNIANGYNRK